MNDDLFVTAIKNGDYISIDEFKPGDGEKCGCFCPQCGEPVRSNVTAKSPEQLKIPFTNRFSHLNKSTECSGGYKETEIHLFAKDLISKTNIIAVPSNRYHYPDKLNYSNVRLEKVFPIEQYKQYRPDILITNSEGLDLAIEIIVTNPVSSEKKDLYTNQMFKSFAIDLSSYYKTNLNEVKERLSEDILSNHKNKFWIWPEVKNELDERSNNSANVSSQQGCLLSATFLLCAFVILLVIIIHSATFIF
jgi:hypothetical protein